MLRVIKFISLFLIVFLISCTNKIQKYQVSKGDYGKEFDHHLSKQDQSYSLTWNAAQDWEKLANDSFSVEKYKLLDYSTLSITKFPGSAGGLLSNVNRWRNQVNLAPISVVELSKFCQSLNSNNLSFTLVQIDGQSSFQGKINFMYIAIVFYEKSTWFFKFTGPKNELFPQLIHCEKFIKSIEPNV